MSFFVNATQNLKSPQRQTNKKTHTSPSQFRFTLQTIMNNLHNKRSSLRSFCCKFVKMHSFLHREKKSQRPPVEEGSVESHHRFFSVLYFHVFFFSLLHKKSSAKRARNVSVLTKINTTKMQFCVITAENH